MYRETFIGQWINLCSDFDHDFELLQHQGEAPESFNRWYKTRVHRWKSITYSEGILLEQVNNAEFAERLRTEMEKFCFQLVEPEKEKSAWTGIAAGAAAGAAAGGILAFLHWGAAKVVISGIALFAVTAAGSLQSNAACRKEEQKRVREGYIGQLKSYEGTLLELFNQYNIS